MMTEQNAVPTTPRARRGRRALVAGSTVALAGVSALASATSASASAASASAARSGGPPARTATPIKHVVVIIGENNTFDTVFGTYKPPAGQSVMNLRSEAIVTPSGAPGPNYAKAEAHTALDTAGFQAKPRITGTYPTLPPPSTTSIAPGCDGQKPNTNDNRFPAKLPPGPYQITKYVPYLQNHTDTTDCQIGAYVGSPLHRFYQMAQQVATAGKNLFTWVEMTAATPSPTRSR